MIEFYSTLFSDLVSLAVCVNLKKHFSVEDFYGLILCFVIHVLAATCVKMCYSKHWLMCWRFPQNTLRRFLLNECEPKCTLYTNSLIIFSVYNHITYVFVDRHVMDCTKKLIWQPIMYVKLAINLTRISGAQIQSFCHSPFNRDRFDTALLLTTNP